ncbi:hypothetical protein ACO0QE_004683 [Hanseniaspora vineae]
MHSIKYIGLGDDSALESNRYSWFEDSFDPDCGEGCDDELAWLAKCKKLIKRTSNNFDNLTV